jgi:RNA polymerase sigma-70 factor (ECF subfamily)
VESLKDRELVLQLQQGDLNALGELYDRHRRLVYRTALAITGDPEAASDLLQDVFLRLHRFSRGVDISRPLEPWLYRVTANLSYDWVKRLKRRPHPLEDLADWLVGPSRNQPSEAAERHDEWSQVQRAVAALPLAQRVVVVLFYLNDLAVQDIASILELPIGTVKSRLHYGRLALKKSLGLSLDLLPELHYERP